MMPKTKTITLPTGVQVKHTTTTKQGKTITTCKVINYKF